LHLNLKNSYLVLIHCFTDRLLYSVSCNLRKGLTAQVPSVAYRRSESEIAGERRSSGPYPPCRDALSAAVTAGDPPET